MLELRRSERLRIKQESLKRELQTVWEDRRTKKSKPSNETPNALEFAEPGKDVTLTLRFHLKTYLHDIETVTGRKIQKKQRDILQNYVEKHSVVKLTDKEKEIHRSAFNSVRMKVRSEWEQQTGQRWPKYENHIYVNNKIARKAGSFYDAHHIVENSYGGPHEWWNLHPAAYPNQHQDGIHHDDSIATKIFGPILPEYHTKPTDVKDRYVSIKRNPKV